MASPRILVCGGRDFNDKDLLYSTIDKVCLERDWITPPDEYGNWLPNIFIIHGGAKGADDLADQYAVISWTGLDVFKADWSTYGKSAGPIRNQQMLDEGEPDLVIAFPTKNSRGTWDMINRAKKAGVETIVIGP